MRQIPYYFDKSECLIVVISKKELHIPLISCLVLNKLKAYMCVCARSVNPSVLFVTSRSAWPALAAADHAISHGFDIGAAGNLVR